MFFISKFIIQIENLFFECPSKGHKEVSVEVSTGSKESTTSSDLVLDGSKPVLRLFFTREPRTAPRRGWSSSTTTTCI